jgi:hypothetical protein
MPRWAGPGGGSTRRLGLVGYVATEVVKPLVKTRRETSGEERMVPMRARFGARV